MTRGAFDKIAAGLLDAIAYAAEQHSQSREPSGTKVLMTLWSTDHAAFFGALDMPPEPTERLRAAFARHRATRVGNARIKRTARRNPNG